MVRSVPVLNLPENCIIPFFYGPFLTNIIFIFNFAYTATSKPEY